MPPKMSGVPEQEPKQNLPEFQHTNELSRHRNGNDYSVIDINPNPVERLVEYAVDPKIRNEYETDNLMENYQSLDEEDKDTHNLVVGSTVSRMPQVEQISLLRQVFDRIIYDSQDVNVGLLLTLSRFNTENVSLMGRELLTTSTAENLDRVKNFYEKVSKIDTRAQGEEMIEVLENYKQALIGEIYSRTYIYSQTEDMEGKISRLKSKA
jgi:hypothetical protein